MKHYQIIITLLCLTTLTGCYTVATMKLKNLSQQPIAVIYPNGQHSTIIKPNKRQKTMIAPCIRIQTNDTIYNYDGLKFSIKYTNNKKSPSAIFTHDHQLQIYEKDNADGFVTLEQTCNEGE